MASYKISGALGLPAFPLSVIFIDKYMPRANPTFVKVYLYGLRLCYAAGAEKDNKVIAEALDILESDVYLAWKYWESVGVININENDEIEFIDLTIQAPALKAEKPQYKAKDLAVAIEENKDIKLLLEHAQNIFGKTFSVSDTGTLYSFYDWFELPVEVILMLLEHCASLNKFNMRYAEKIAIRWAEEGIDTIEKAHKHLKNSEARGKTERKYKKLLGISDRDLTDAEYAFIVQWTDKMGMPIELIKIAYEKAVMATGNGSFPYINGIIQSWQKLGIRTVADLEKDVVPEKKTFIKGNTKNKFVDYEQSGEYDFDEIERKALEKRLKAKN